MWVHKDLLCLMLGAMNEVNLQDLRMLTAVAEEGSFGRAAIRLSVSQQAVSLRAVNLEQRMDMVLFARSVNGVTLTNDGRLVAEWAATLLDAAQRFEVAVETLRGPKRGRLRVAASFTVAEYLLPQWIGELHARSTGAKMMLDVRNSGQVTTMVRESEVDLGFTENSVVPTGLRSQVVGSDRLVLIVDAKHKLARRRTPLRLHQLGELRLVVREQGSGTRTFLHDLLSSVGTEEQPSIEVSSTAALKAAVLQSGEPGIVSSLAVERELEMGTLREVAVEGLEKPRYLRAIWHPKRELSLPASLLLSIAKPSRG